MNKKISKTIILSIIILLSIVIFGINIGGLDENEVKQLSILYVPIKSFQLSLVFTYNTQIIFTKEGNYKKKQSKIYNKNFLFFFMSTYCIFPIIFIGIRMWGGVLSFESLIAGLTTFETVYGVAFNIIFKKIYKSNT